jgi:hypothetical protein
MIENSFWITGIIVVGFFIAYRLYKWLSRRCSCGSVWYWRSHKIVREGNGFYSPITFRKCFGCGTFTGIKSETKRFSTLGLWWRETFHWWQFVDVGEYMRRAGILVNNTVHKPFSHKRIRIQSLTQPEVRFQGVSRSSFLRLRLHVNEHRDKLRHD